MKLTLILFKYLVDLNSRQSSNHDRIVVLPKPTIVAPFWKMQKIFKQTQDSVPAGGSQTNLTVELKCTGDEYLKVIFSVTLSYVFSVMCTFCEGSYSEK